MSRGFHFTIPQSYDPTIPVFYNPTIPVFHNLTIPLSQYLTVPLSHKATIPQSHYSTIPCPTIPQSHYSTFPLFHNPTRLQAPTISSRKPAAQRHLVRAVEKTRKRRESLPKNPSEKMAAAHVRRPENLPYMQARRCVRPPIKELSLAREQNMDVRANKGTRNRAPRGGQTWGNSLLHRRRAMKPQTEER